jgi:NADPH:quinone reductase-like Zn-dependent oxidoreductase
MHAIRLHAYGPAENLTYEQVEDPRPGPGQVRVAVRAAGVHLLDTALREGGQGPAPEPTPLPTIPGREVAGVVESLGEGVADLWLGKRVVAHLGFVPGGYAELAVTEAERLHEIPRNLDFAEAVALLGPGGKHIVFGWSAEGIQDGGPYLVDGVSEQVLGPVMLRKAGGPDPVRTLELRALTEAAAGRLTPAVQRFPLREAAAAHRALESRGTIGKVVLEP